MTWMPWKRWVDCYDRQGNKLDTVTPDKAGTFQVPKGTDRFVSTTEFRRLPAPKKVKTK